MLNDSKEFFDSVLPLKLHEPNGDDDNAIEQRIVEVYGPQGCGKTTFLKSLAAEAVARYGIKNVNATVTSFDLAPSIIATFNTIPKKPINFLGVEDINVKNISPELINRFFTIRHVMMELTGFRMGLVMVAFTTHSLFSMPKDFRTNVNVFVAKGFPNTPFDKGIFKMYIPSEYYETFKENSADNSAFMYDVSLPYVETKGVAALMRPVNNYLRPIRYTVKCKQTRQGRYGRMSGTEQKMYTCDTFQSPFEVNVGKEAAKSDKTYGEKRN